MPCVSAEKLAIHFQTVIENQYIESVEDTGKPVWELLDEDWLLLKNLDEESRSSLFTEMFPDEQITEKKIYPEDYPATDKIERWEDFKEELKHENSTFTKRVRAEMKLKYFSNI